MVFVAIFFLLFGLIIYSLFSSFIGAVYMGHNCINMYLGGPLLAGGIKEILIIFGCAFEKNVTVNFMGEACYMLVVLQAWGFHGCVNSRRGSVSLLLAHGIFLSHPPHFKVIFPFFILYSVYPHFICGYLFRVYSSWDDYW